MSYALYDSTGYLTDVASIGGWKRFCAWAITRGVHAFTDAGQTTDPVHVAHALAGLNAADPGVESIRRTLVDAADRAQDYLVLTDGTDIETPTTAEEKGHAFHGNQYTQFAGEADSEHVMPMFHGTASTALASIKKHGLIPKGSKGAGTWAVKHGPQGDMLKTLKRMDVEIDGRAQSVFLTTRPDQALGFAVMAAKVNARAEPLLLQVNVPKDWITPKRMAIDEASDPLVKAYRITGTIPPEHIRVVDLETGGLKNLAAGDHTFYVVLICTKDVSVTVPTTAAQSPLDALLAPVLAHTAEVWTSLIPDVLHRTLVAGGQVGARTIGRLTSAEDAGHPFHGNQWTGGGSFGLPPTHDDPAPGKDFFYHATPKANLESIAAKGLTGGADKRLISLTPHLESASFWTSSIVPGHDEDVALLRVKREDVQTRTHDQHDDGDRYDPTDETAETGTFHDVSADKLEVYHDGRWEPLARSARSLAFNPDEPRDDHGKWTASGGPHDTGVYVMPRTEMSDKVMSHIETLHGAAVRLDFPPNNVRISTYDREFERGGQTFHEAAHYTPDANVIVMNTKSLEKIDNHTAEQLFVHEVMHRDFHEVSDALGLEASGMAPPNRALSPAEQQVVDIYHGEANALMNDDGITGYSRAYWREAAAASEDDLDEKFHRATNETLAEIASIDLGRAFGLRYRDSTANDPSPTWRKLYDAVRTAAKEIRDRKRVKTAEAAGHAFHGNQWTGGLGTDQAELGRKLSAQTWLHGTDTSANGVLKDPVFLTTSPAGADWFAANRGTTPMILPTRVSVVNPLPLNNYEDAVRLRDVLAAQGLRVDLTPPTASVGWEWESHIPGVDDSYNPIDVVYSRQAREAIRAAGYDAVYTKSDTLESGEIEALVTMDAQRQVTGKFTGRALEDGDQHA